MFNLGAITPLSVHSLGIVRGMDGDVGDQDQIVIQVGIVSDQSPQRLLGFGDADLEPAQLDVYDPHLAGMGEGHAESQGQRHGSGQIIQHFKLPAIQALVVDLYLAIMAHAEDELAMDQAHLLEDLLVIQPGITHKTQLGVREQGAGDAYGPVDLPILAYEVIGHVREPIGIRHHWLRQIDHGGCHGWVARCQTFLLAWWPRRRTLHDRGNAFQPLRIRLLKVHRVQRHYQVRGCVLRHCALSDPIQAFQQVTVAEPLVPYEPIQPLSHRPDGLPLADYPPRHLCHHWRLSRYDPLHRQLAHSPQTLLRQLRRDRFQKCLQLILKLSHRQVGNRVTFQYRIHAPSSAVVWLCVLPSILRWTEFSSSKQHVGNHQC